MKQFVFCCLFIAVLMACSTRPSVLDIEGRWSIEMEGNSDTVIVMNGDTIVAPEMRFDTDSVYLEVWANGMKTHSENLGLYSLENDILTFTNLYGDKKEGRLEIKDDRLCVFDRNDPQKIIMRLVRIRE